MARKKKTEIPTEVNLEESDPHYFDFDLDRGIRQQVVEKLEGSPLLKLEKGAGPQNSGIYALYYKSRLVYIGKASKGMTKSGRTLRARLNEHVSKISSRQNIVLKNMKFRYLTFSSEWWVFAAEYAIIAHYHPEWNESGFGSKVPGKGRPGTDRVSRWDDQFPKI
jgi:hypothetical protein